MKKNNKGFSLVELIVVIAIMAILASVAVAGFSLYIPKAKKANDEQLAADIEYALELAVQAGELTPGDYVVIKADGAVAVFGNNNNNPDDTGATIDAAMKTAFGENWATELGLSYDGWELGILTDSEMMGYVNESSYNGSGLGTLLGQVQNVVTAAGDYLNGTVLDNVNLIDYLEKADVALGEGNTVTEENSSAVANAAVFCVADIIVDSHTGTMQEFYYGWLGGEVSEDPIANQAARYSVALGMATYLDKMNNGTTDYVEQLTAETDDPADIIPQMNNLMGIMMQDPKASEYMGIGDDGNVNTSAQGYKDSMAFLSYMRGVQESSEAMLENHNIYSDTYFSDGKMESYVQNYVDIGNILRGIATNEGAFVFIYDGDSVVCVPLDY